MPGGELEQSSRKTIIETGFSEAYFDKHFRIVARFDKRVDIRVVWRFSVNGYEDTRGRACIVQRRFLETSPTTPREH